MLTLTEKLELLDKLHPSVSSDPEIIIILSNDEIKLLNSLLCKEIESVDKHPLGSFGYVDKDKNE